MRIKEKTKKTIIYLLILIIGGGFLYHNIRDKSEEMYLTKEQKESLKYDYEIPKDLIVYDIVDKDKVLVNDYLPEESSKLKIFHLDTEEVTDVIERNDMNEPKYFDGGVIWIEDNESGNNELYIKYFTDDEVIKIDEGKSVSNCSIADNYLTYCMQDDTYAMYDKYYTNVKLFDIKEKRTKTIATYDSYNEEGDLYIMGPNSNYSIVVWSTSRDKSQNNTIYSYNIKEGTTSIVSENSVIDNPILKGDRLFAVKEGNKDVIVEYNVEDKRWYEFKSMKIHEYNKHSKQGNMFIHDNDGLLVWEDYVPGEDATYYAYDVINNEFVFPIELKDLRMRINKVKGNVIHYEVYNGHGVFEFLYKHDKDK